MFSLSIPFFHQNLWSQLLSFRFPLWKNYCPSVFFDYLEAFGLFSSSLDIQTVAKLLESKTSFSYYPVSGFVPPNRYLSLLHDHCFPIATTLRTFDENDFSLTPDLIHDLLGHVPWLLHPAFSDFFLNMGRIFNKIVEKVKSLSSKKEIIQILQSHLMAIVRCFWFTVETGLIENHEGRKAYGAALVSSPRELQYAFTNDIQVFPLELDLIINQPFDTSKLQKIFFSIKHFDELLELTLNLEQMIDQGLLESVPLHNQEKCLTGFEVLFQ
ncbi:Phenylalanine-4-hydroxylase,aromatic amino acid hydroxylase,Phenylalanine-4-hydroxylase,phenylalanine-4-hydroxylase,Biopterin-dependent aromatic amino acid hydroxylase [Chlamydia serpentis]|uniref:Phenylalanine-4-hydroxylase,aromatic amino acid hydroxylase,Phenylalanine-4-hydroxylase,phenylalanine-4-hyd roxylase,Biopterin-dependent aromatic amino acid hydroxylase n=1 Tax=Chlamydia serpentis TaxID=1967782 RepID=A0A2R8FCQ3_9CHLA|nr:aromatic amino acid hydroxylase [Chlamydia serpentis]SPN74151.1 Phenylalanine-4-hydroxylase,aromatic amino acid hydroxylase,Phenylalanine-4-hydroxylase,phenylalanine-4-hydroxylase,Biopterin-dependent aromatic amino acid hydroxylase [Chlamydia serpentis]